MEELVMPHKPSVVGVCVECAIRHHDYKEILPHGKGDDHYSEAPLPAAWIDGRRHRLVIPLGMQGTTCSECNRSVHGIHLPMD